MDYKTYKKKNYNLYLLKTKEFKTINISFVFQKKSNALDEPYQVLLKKILALKTEKYASLEELSLAAAKIYNPITYFKTSSSASHRALRLSAEFANEKYTEKGMNEKNLEFIMDYFWNPYIKSGGFDEEIFELCKKNYIEELKSAKNYPEEYSVDRFWEVSDVYDFKLLSNEELIEKLQDIDRIKLYEYYKMLFKAASLDIFIVGDVEDNIINIIDNYIYGSFQPTVNIECKKHSNISLKKVIEKTDNPQSKLLLGYKMIDITKFEENYTAFIFSMILGGGTESFLHKEARSNRSLCYYIYANYYNLFNLILISAGISAKKTEEIIDIVRLEINKIQSGKFSVKKLEEVVNLYKNILLESKDSQSLILNNLISVVMQKNDDIDMRLEKVDKITKQDIINFAKKIDLDTIFLLEGIE